MSDNQQVAILPGGLTEEELRKASEASQQGFDRSEQVIPFLRILQPLSPQIQDMPGAKPGQFCNIATGKLNDKKLIVPIVHQWNYTEWLPEREGFVKDWGEDMQGWQNECDAENKNAFKPITKSGNNILIARHFFVFDIDEEDNDIEACIMPFTGTMLTRAKSWSSKITYAPKIKTGNGLVRAPFYYYNYRMTTEIIKRGPYTWYLPIINLNMENGKAISTLDLPNGKAIWDAARRFEESYNAGEIKVASQEEEEGF